jgi:hypothetical protein
MRSAVRGPTRREGGQRGRRFIANSILEVDLLKEKKGVRFVERGEGAVELQVRHHVKKSPIETTDHRHHQGLIADRIAKFIESTRHRLQPPTVVGDVEGTLLELVELGREHEGT